MPASEEPPAADHAGPAYRHIARRLRELILDGRLAPGERLPNEAELSASFAVSRSTIREALRELSSQNLLVTTRGVTGGSFVAHPEPEQISGSLEAGLGLLSMRREVSVDTLLEARELLEVPAARLAANRRSDEQLAQLHAAVREEHAALRSDFEGHRRFHAAVLDAAGNALLEIMTQPLFSVLRTRFLRDEASPKFWEQVAEDHGLILACIEDGDGEGAAQEMLHHLERLRDTYLEIDSRGPRS